MAIDSSKQDLIPEVNKKEFVDYAFSIIKIVIALAEGGTLDEFQEVDLAIARKIYEKEHNLKNHLYIKKHSAIDCFRNKRKKKIQTNRRKRELSLDYRPTAKP